VIPDRCIESRRTLVSEEKPDDRSPEPSREERHEQTLRGVSSALLAELVRHNEREDEEHEQFEEADDGEEKMTHREMKRIASRSIQQHSTKSFLI
jgi:hypothetical protein